MKKLAILACLFLAFTASKCTVINNPASYAADIVRN
jgi:hypothetical protein